MALGQATEREFTAPAGSLTVLLACGWSRRGRLLTVLESSRRKGLGVVAGARDAERGPGTANPGGREPAADEAEQLRFVADRVRRWLGEHPEEPRELDAGTEAIVAMACCWSTAVTHALAERPMTLPELDEQVRAIDSEEVLLEHVEALVETGQAQAARRGGELRYALTEWGVRAIAPLVAAARCEANFPREDVLAPEVLDAEAAFQLTLPLLRLPGELHGACSLKVLVPAESPDEDLLFAGASVEVADGRVASSSILLEESPQTWITGSAKSWCEAVIDPSSPSGLQLGGDTGLGEALLRALHEALFGEPR